MDLLSLKKIASVSVCILIAVIIGVIGIFDNQKPALNYTGYNYVKTEPTTVDLTRELNPIGEYEYIGNLTTIKFPVLIKDLENPIIEWRSYTKVSGFYDVFEQNIHTQDTLILIDQHNQTINYPLKNTGDPSTYRLLQNQDAKGIHIKGTTYNYTGWNGETFKVLKVDYINPFTVKNKPNPFAVLSY